MFTLLNFLSERLVFAVGLLAGSQLPSFVAQYRQRLGGHLDQAQADLLGFQTVADRYHGGSLGRLIEHQLASSDPTFHGEGEVITGLSTRANELLESNVALETDLYHQLIYLSQHLDTDIAMATWQIYTPGIAFTLEATILALTIAFSLNLVFTAIVAMLRAVLVRLGVLLPA